MEALYNKFRFVGTMGFNDTKTKPEEKKDDKTGRLTIDSGHIKKEVMFKDGQPNFSKEALSVFVEANGVKQYLTIQDMTFAGDKTFFHMNKDTKEKTYLPDAQGSDPKLIETCMDFLIKKIKVGENEFKTMSSAHFLGAMQQFMPHLKGKRVTVDGNVTTSISKGKTYLNYEVNSIRLAYENEVDHLGCEFEIMMIRDSVNAPTFEQYTDMEVKKVPINFFVGCSEKNPATNKKEPKIFKTNDIFFLDMEGMDSEENFNMIIQMMNILPDGSELEDMKYYKTKYSATIRGESKSGELTEEELTPQEKFSMERRGRTLEEIKAHRGVKKKSSKLLIIEPISIGGVVETEVAQSDIFGSAAAPKQISVAEAQAMTGGTVSIPTPVQQAPVVTATVTPTQVAPVVPVTPTVPVTPSVPTQTAPLVGGIDMSQFIK